MKVGNMKKKYISYKDKADYNVKWETIYANKNITEEEINEFKNQLEEKGYRVINVLIGSK